IDWLDVVVSSSTFVGTLAIAFSFWSLSSDPPEAPPVFVRIGGPVLLFSGMWLTLVKLRSVPKTLEVQSARLLELDTIAKTLEQFRHSIDVTTHISSLERFRLSDSPVPRTVAASLLDAWNSFRKVPSAIDDFEKRCGTVKVEERYLVSEILRDLARILPDKGQWKGITLLKGSWGEQADPMFKSFDRELQARANSKSLAVWRIFFVQANSDESTRKYFDQVIAEQEKAGIVTKRIEYGMKTAQIPPQERSLLYSEPAKGFCALESALENDSLLSSIEVISPENDRFKELEVDFDRLWNS
ncbi:MAG: hypothetical protein ACRDHN_01385, partial [Thermomicrobiales bacterium]